MASPSEQAEQAMLATKKVRERIHSIERSIRKAKEYMESGEHAHWFGFRPLFVDKVRDGKELPPHKDWVEHVFLRRLERMLVRTERVLERLAETDRRERSLRFATRTQFAGRSTRRVADRQP